MEILGSCLVFWLLVSEVIDVSMTCQNADNFQEEALELWLVGR